MASETVWLRNVETGLVWEVVKGSEHEARLRKEVNAESGERVYENAPGGKAPKAEKSGKQAKTSEPAGPDPDGKGEQDPDAEGSKDDA